MKKLNLIVITKEKESGLLSISGNRSKSIVPILGGPKILDFYLYPLRSKIFNKIFINIKSEDIDIRDYVNYYYKDYSINLLVGDNLLDTLIRVLKPETDPTLIVQADGFIYCNWDVFRNELMELKNDNNVLVFNDRGKFEALYIGNVGNFLTLLTKEQKNYFNFKHNKSYDELWKDLISFAKDNYNKVSVKSIEFYHSLKTVKEYYDFHIDLLKDMNRCYMYSSIFPGEDSKEKDETSITSGGSVKNSYISTSSSIEGKVEKSFIFSNVKVSKNAYLYKSIIMNNIIIAENALIENIILCDGGKLLQNVLPTVGEGATLGGKIKDGFNKLFPEYIYGGISLVGSNVEIPKGFTASENCYIPSDTGKLILKAKKKLENGESLLN